MSSRALNYFKFVNGKDMVNIQNDDKIVIIFTHSTDKRGVEPCTDPGGLFDFISIKADDFLHGIGQGAQVSGFTFNDYFGNDDTRIFGCLDFTNAERFRETIDT